MFCLRCIQIIYCLFTAAKSTYLYEILCAVISCVMDVLACNHASVGVRFIPDPLCFPQTTASAYRRTTPRSCTRSSRRNCTTTCATAARRTSRPSRRSRCRTSSTCRTCFVSASRSRSSTSGTQTEVSSSLGRVRFSLHRWVGFSPDEAVLVQLGWSHFRSWGRKSS